LKQTVFIASTVFDLIDVRAELEELIQEIGLTPLLSDSATSDFTVLPDKNSIETCLVNVRASNYFIVVLSQRYGPSLARAGFPDLSATHLEYREAKENKLPVYFYVRDRLESGYRIWKSNDKSKSLNLLWVEQDNFRLFDFIEEHQKLIASSPTNNWYQTFRSSVELKNLVRRDLRIPAGRAALAKTIIEGNVPIIQGKSSVTRFSNEFVLECELRNFGNVAAFNLRTSWEGETDRQGSFIPAVAPDNQFSVQVNLG